MNVAVVRSPTRSQAHLGIIHSIIRMLLHSLFIVALRLKSNDVHARQLIRQLMQFVPNADLPVPLSIGGRFMRVVMPLIDRARHDEFHMEQWRSGHQRTEQVQRGQVERKHARTMRTADLRTGEVPTEQSQRGNEAEHGHQADSAT